MDVLNMVKNYTAIVSFKDTPEKEKIVKMLDSDAEKPKYAINTDEDDDLSNTIIIKMENEEKFDALVDKMKTDSIEVVNTIEIDDDAKGEFCEEDLDDDDVEEECPELEDSDAGAEDPEDEEKDESEEEPEEEESDEEIEEPEVSDSEEE